MTFDPAATHTALRDKALATGKFARIDGHEPTTPKDSGATAAIWLQSIGPSRKVSGLTATAASVVYMMRIYTPANQPNLDGIDPDMAAATVAMISLLSGDFTLGDSVFAVDLLGAWGAASLASKAGYADVSGTPYRITDITIPLIIDGVWAQEAVAA